jgi:hypothetical protein
MIGAIRQLFRAAVNVVTWRVENPQPRARRRRGETDKGFVAACRAMLRRVVRTGATARDRAAALQPVPKVREAIAPTSAYASTSLYLSDTLDWLNLWQDNAGYDDHWIDDDFGAKQEETFPQP